MSRTTTAIAALALLGAVTVPAWAARDTSRACPDGDVPPAGYTDIASNVHRPAIDCIAWWDIDVYGGTGSYSPSTAITRGEQAALLANLLDASGLQDRGSTADQGFTDVRGHKYEAQINRLVSLDVIAGKTASTFDPDGTITRAQMASLIVQLHEKVYGRTIQPGDGFSDVPSSNPHEPNVRRLVAAGITDGTSETTYSPAGRVTRAQIASFTMRHTALLVELDEASLPGYFDPIRLSGTSDDVVDTAIPNDELAIAEVTFSGDGYSSIWVTDANHEKVALLAGEIGTWTGIVPVNFWLDDPMRGLDVSAESSWSVTFKPVTDARDLTSNGLSGSTADVLDGYRLAGQTVDITYEGDNYFSVKAYDDDGEYLELISSEIGTYSGTRRLPAATRWVVVEGNGAWTINPAS